MLLFTRNKVDVFTRGPILYKPIFDHIYIFTSRRSSLFTNVHIITHTIQLALFIHVCYPLY